MQEDVILVDRNDTETGTMEKLEAHRKALLHRAVSVFIFNSDHHLLLQKRALEKYHSPGLWTNTACTHPRPGEPAQEAAVRRLREEMGINQHKLDKLFDFIYKAPLDKGLTEHEFDHVFLGFSDSTPDPNPAEVCRYTWTEPTELMKGIENHPENYTVWFKKIIGRVLTEANHFNPKP
ncbi:MAG TPA: isopentenyl-diphosphate Delta-isomerase [Bacteroidales bacterium]|nr:isopentenyl-diphosphate Delta-isomerase [Bacteroidales bacterium]